MKPRGPLTSITPVMTADSVKPTSLPLGVLLSQRYPAYVPRYQRGYAWDDEPVEDLIEDVAALVAAGTGTRGHFYGGMVAISVPDASETGGHQYEVVDGQQRLATFLLLLSQAALRADELADEAEHGNASQDALKFRVLAEQIRDDHLYYIRYDTANGTKSAAPRLRLSKADDQVFQDLLAGNKPSPSTRVSHQRLVSAAASLKRDLIDDGTSGSHDEAFNHLEAVRSAVLQDSFVIHIVGDSRASGYRLFAVLNDRGARLRVADLLRSHSLELLESHGVEQEKAAGIWDDVLEGGAEAVDDFLITYYTSMTGKRAKDDLFDRMKELLFPASSTAAEHVSALTAMATELDTFLKVSQGQWPYASSEADKEVTNWDRNRLNILIKILQHKLSMPLLLAARPVSDEKQYAQLVRMLEIFAFRYKNLCGAHVGPAQAAYYAECRDLRAITGRLMGNSVKGTGTPAGVTNGVSKSGNSKTTPTGPDFKKLRKALTAQINKRAGDQILENVIRDQIRYDAGSAAKANMRLLLVAIEDHQAWLKSGGTASPTPSKIAVTDLSQVSIEHVEPEHATSPRPEFAGHLHRLGNLSYWEPGENSGAGNEPFEDKLALYGASKVSLNHDLAKITSWTLETLEKRESLLVAQACKILVP